MPYLYTTLGPKSASDLRMILPHEHVFVDLRTWDKPGYAQAEAADVIAVMAPEIERIKALGVTALIECTPIGVGRRADLDKAVSQATGFPIAVPTGIYREPWIPPWAHEAGEDALCDWMLGELNDHLQESDFPAAWIKLSAGDDGLTATETKILKAATRASAATGALIGSHTIRGRVVRDQLDIIEATGGSPRRYVWIHTQAESDFALHLEMVKRGAWVEYDALGNPDAPDDDTVIGWLWALHDAGFGAQVLLSHDRGWFDPGTPDFVPKPYTYLSETFIPKLRAAGFDDETIRQLTHVNPFNAFAR